MNVTAYELKTRSGELLARAAAGEEIVITKRGVVTAKLVPPDHFDPKLQEQAFERIERVRGQIAARGKKFTRADIKKAVDWGRL